MTGKFSKRAGNVRNMVKRGQRRGTLASVAAQLGVSRTTVSNAYNRPEQLSAALRQKILAAAEEMGYPGPDPTARSLRTRRAGAVGVVLTEHLSYAFEDAASVEFLAGMAESTYGTDMSLSLIPAGPDTAKADQATQIVNRAVVDGFVIYSVAENDPHLKSVLIRHSPALIVDQPKDIPDAAFVGIDDREAIKPAAQALIDAGHKHIGILAIRLTAERHNGVITRDIVENAELHVQRDRVLGALDVLAEAGIDADSVPVITRHINDPANAKSAAKELLEHFPETTAVLCTTDSMAFGVLDYAAERGMKIPEDLSVTGFDGTQRALLMDLSTVIQPNKAKGAAAGKMLNEMIAFETNRDSIPAERIMDGLVQAPGGTKLLRTHYHPGSTVCPPRS